jgi:signal transduction histidine kinase
VAARPRGGGAALRRDLVQTVRRRAELRGGQPCGDLRTRHRLPGRVWFNREPFYIPDIVRDANFLREPIVDREVLHAALGFPILLSGDVLGVMEFFSHEIRQPDQVLLDMMATIGSQIGQFIERKRTEEGLRRTQAELAHVTRVTTLGQLAASIAHEVNQPLAAIVADGNACLNWLADAEPDLEKIREALDAIVKDGHRAGDLDLNEVVGDVLPLVRAELRDGGVSLRVELAPGLGPVLGDRVQLQQVILNLVMNSIDAMAAVEARPRELTIRTQRHDADTSPWPCTTPGWESPTTMSIGCSAPSSPPSRAALEWGCRSAGRSSRRPAGGSGRPRISRMVLSSSSRNGLRRGCGGPGGSCLRCSAVIRPTGAEVQ